MRIKDLGTRAASASLRAIISQVTARGHAPAITVERRIRPYWEERGWTRQGNTYSGNYQTRYGAFQGWIEQDRSGRIHFYLRAPSDAIRSHGHWTCFQHRNDDWFLIHMGREAKDVSSGIMIIEQLIREAYEI